MYVCITCAYKNCLKISRNSDSKTDERFICIVMALAALSSCNPIKTRQLATDTPWNKHPFSHALETLIVSKVHQAATH